MKLMNEHGKHKLRRSDRIRKNNQLKLLEDDPYHFHKKQCHVLDVFERKISMLEERVNLLEKKDPEKPGTEKPTEPIDEGFPWDAFLFFLGLVMLFYYYFPSKVTVHYTYRQAIEPSGESLQTSAL